MKYQLIKACSKVLVTELYEKKQNNLLKGNTSIERYEYYEEILKNENEINLILDKYPVLKTIIMNKINSFLTLIEEALTSLVKDSDDIEKILNINIKELNNIDFSLGDSHNGGKSVLVFIANDNKKIVYKPHGLNCEILFEFIMT